jgi:hypothetical protein
MLMAVISTQAQYTISNPKVVTSFPYVDSGASSVNGQSASGMQGVCSALACCSVAVYKVTLPTNGVLRVELSPYVPLSSSIIAYRSTVANPSTFADLEYVASQPGNFCGYRDTLLLGRAYVAWRSVPLGGKPPFTGLSMVYDFNNPSHQAGFMPAGDYYILMFNENQQANIGGGTVDVSFEFAEACAPLSAPAELSFDTLEVNAESDTMAFYLHNDRTEDVVIDTANMSIIGLHASDFSILSYPDTSLAVGDSTEVQIRFAPILGGQRMAVLEVPFSDTSCTTSTTIDLNGYGARPTISIRGGSQFINNNDITPSINNATDLGSIVSTTRAIYQRYELINSGSDTLELSGSPLVDISGSGQFMLSAAPASRILPLDTSYFTIGFIPMVDGLDTATIQIINNDADNGTYRFSIRGEGAERNALHFDGVNDYVEINNVATDMAGQITWTMEAWVKADPTQSGNDRFLAVNTSGNGNVVLLGLSDGLLNYYDGTSYNLSTVDLRDDTWHHLAVSYDNGEVKAYIDGRLTGTPLTSSITFAANNKWSIGQEFDSGSTSEHFKGGIEEVRIWKKVLTAEEIDGQRLCEITQADTNLMAYYSFNQGQAGADNSVQNEVLDQSTRRNHGAFNNFALNGANSNFFRATPVAINCSSSSLEACGDYSSVTGKVYDSSGIYTDTLFAQTAIGQDSLVIVSLTVFEGINLSINIDSNVTSMGSADGGLTALASGGTRPMTFTWSNGANSTGDLLAFQSFESQAGDTWNYTSDPAPYATETDSVIAGSEDIWSVIRAFTGDIDTASEGSNFWGMQDLDNSNGGRSSFHYLSLDPIDISGEQEVQLSFDYYSVGYDASDSIEYQVVFDNGTNWVARGIALEKNTDAWTTVSIEIPDTASYLRLRLQAKQNGSSDYAGFDNIRLSAQKSVLSGLSAGTYSLTVSDANGCEDQASVTLGAITPLSLQLMLDSNVSCYAKQDGGATAIASGGTSPYTYAWSNGASTASVSGLGGGTYTVTLTDNNGTIIFDSVLIREPAVISTTTTVTACDVYTWPQNGQTYIVSGLYRDTVSSAAACDSILILDLSIHQSSSSLLVESACASYTWIQNGQTYIMSGIYKDTLRNAVGCDSIITLDLSINAPSSATFTDTACISYTWPQNGQTYTASGIYKDTLPNAVGCDSIVSLDLTINAPSSATFKDTACTSYTWLQSGQTYTLSGTYKDTLVNAVGCDSIVTLDLKIDTINTGLSQNGNVLTANQAGASYRWLDCNNAFAPIVGANSPSYVAATNGSYAVELVLNSCTDTSACFTVIGVGIAKETLEGTSRLYPNPSEGRIVLEQEQLGTIKEYRILTSSGQLLVQQKVKQRLEEIKLKGAKGVYFIELIHQDGRKSVKKIVKQ